MGQPDRLDMDTGATTGAMRRVAVTGDQMDSGWRAVSARLDGAVGQLGRGELGAAFMAGYETPAAETAATVGRHCQVPGRLADMGHACVAAYESADERSRAAFPPMRP
jgi:hypothetical protein